MKYFFFLPILIIYFPIQNCFSQEIQKVDQLIFAEQYSEAVPLLESMIKKDSIDINTYFRLGKVYQNLQQYGKSIEIFEKAVKIDSASIPILLNLGKCYFFAGNYPASEKILLRLHVVDSTNYQANLLLAKIYATQNNNSESLTIYQKLSKKDSLNPYIYKQIGNLKKRMQDYMGSLASYLKSNKLNPKDLSVLLHVIQQFYEMTGYEQALGYANKGLAIYPNNYLLLKKKAQVLIGLEWYENALLILKNLEEKKLLTSIAYKQLGICYMQTRKYEQAIKSFDRCGQSFEKDPMINFYKGICFSRLHQSQKGIKHLEDAISEITPQIKASMHLHLAKTYGNARQFEESIDQYKKYFEMDQSNPDVLYEIATTYEEFGDNKKKALKYYSQFINQTDNKDDQKYEYAKARILQIKEKIHFER